MAMKNKRFCSNMYDVRIFQTEQNICQDNCAGEGGSEYSTVATAII